MLSWASTGQLAYKSEGDEEAVMAVYYKALFILVLSIEIYSIALGELISVL
jgi:hypothetical protein